jgi:hypothetical protein
MVIYFISSATTHATEALGAIALNALKQETTAKIGIKNKPLKARWSEDYLLKVLSHLTI